MEISRRSFIASVLGAVAAGAVLDVEKLLWEPGAKAIFLPSPIPLITIPRMTRGDLFTIDGQYARNPITGLFTPHLQYFVVTADVESDRATEIELWPAIDGSLRVRPYAKIHQLGYNPDAPIGCRVNG